MSPASSSVMPGEEVRVDDGWGAGVLGVWRTSAVSLSISVGGFAVTACFG